jgi:Neutral/alkaline non-lysosomal ceramidase, N-terminal
MPWCMAVCSFVALLILQAELVGAAEWKAGAAKRVITPAEPMWMSGYGNRDHASEGTLHDLWCKALAIQDPANKRVIVLTLDLCGISKSVSDTVCQRISQQLGIGRESIMICCSHTHTGPMVENNLETMFELTQEETAKIKSYTRSLEDKIVEAAVESIHNLEPARLAWANGSATFAVNRRNNQEAKVPELRERGELKGPVDHEVPVLCVRDLQGKITAIVCGYACHCTVLSFYQWTGDYAGFAQIELEKNHPGAIALFFAGCGADQNPLPRRTVDHAEQYGHELARSVDSVLRGAMSNSGDRLTARFDLLPLPFESVPSSDDLKQQLDNGSVYEKRRARMLLGELEKTGRLASTYPYPVQVWRFGDGQEALTWIALGGEVTAGYSNRLKRELVPGKTWVTAYANDVMAYIPTRRVWDEGGYEGGGAMVYYGLPTRWAGNIEDLIVGKVHELVHPK